eukprot:gene11189-biopygen13691
MIVVGDAPAPPRIGRTRSRSLLGGMLQGRGPRALQGHAPGSRPMHPSWARSRVEAHAPFRGALQGRGPRALQGHAPGSRPMYPSGREGIECRRRHATQIRVSLRRAAARGRARAPLAPPLRFAARAAPSAFRTRLA